jgi:hypothetical protein
MQSSEQVQQEMEKTNNENTCQTQDRIIPTHPDDIAFIKTYPIDVINGVTLPSGLKIPDCKDGKNWRIRDNYEIHFI